MDIDRDVNHVANAYVYISESDTKSMNLESKLVSTILTYKSNHNTTAQWLTTPSIAYINRVKILN